MLGHRSQRARMTDGLLVDLSSKVHREKSTCRIIICNHRAIWSGPFFSVVPMSARRYRSVFSSLWKCDASIVPIFGIIHPRVTYGFV